MINSADCLLAGAAVIISQVAVALMHGRKKLKKRRRPLSVQNIWIRYFSILLEEVE
jgi:hypothetical protein